MRAKIWRAVKDLWSKAMGANLPNFQPYATERFPPQCAVWRWADNGTAYFITLLAHKNDDIFLIELSVSRHGFLLGDTRVDRQPAETVRLDRLSDPSLLVDRWWEIVPRESLEEMTIRLQKGEFYPPEEEIEVSLSRIPALVDDAMKQLMKHGLDYFRVQAPTSSSRTGDER